VSLNYDRFGLEVKLAVAGREQNREFREASVLREIEGLSYQEIADVSGAPVCTGMSRKGRGRDWLKDDWLHIHRVPHSILKISNTLSQAVAQVR
jgi:hypothetical protein